MTIAAIKKLLGNPYYEAPNCLIYCGDASDYMRHMPENSITLTVTSPPYNIGKAYEDQLILETYIDWCEEWINEIYRVTIHNGSFWLNLGYLSIPDRAKAIPIPYLLWEKIPFYLIQEIVWNYGAGVAGKKFFSPRNEKFLWYVKDAESYIFNLDEIRDPNVKYPNQKKNGKIKVNPLGKNPSDVWQFKKVTSGKNRASKERTSHPAQFPIEVIERIVRASSNLNDLIMDPFMGSGTTAVASLNLDRSVIGFEIQKDYCDIAASRIENHLQQLALPKQSSLFANG
jgi:adenine-specific DNA-methyltransferase